MNWQPATRPADGGDDGGDNDNPLIDSGTVVTDFEEYTFRAETPGFFVGDDMRKFTGEKESFKQIRLESYEGDGTLRFMALPDALQRLPVELTAQIFGHLDVNTVMAFRNASQGARVLVDGIHTFRVVATFPKLLGILLRLKWQYLDLKTLVKRIRDHRCYLCGELGDIFYLITAQRLCYNCWTKGDRVAVQFLTRPDVNHGSLLSRSSREWLLREREKIPHMLVPGGHYGHNGNLSLIEPVLAMDLTAFHAKSPHLGAMWMWNILSNDHVSSALWYISVIRAPCLDEATGCWDEGFLCRACTDQDWAKRDIDRHGIILGSHSASAGLIWRRYTRDGIVSHIAEFGSIRKVEVEKEGKRIQRYVHKHPFLIYNPAIVRDSQ